MISRTTFCHDDTHRLTRWKQHQQHRHSWLLSPYQTALRMFFTYAFNWQLKMVHALHSCYSLGCCLCASEPDWCTASLTGSPEGSLWCSVLCWSKGDTGSWAAAFCWVCVSRGTGKGLRNGLPGSSGRPRYCWGTHRARSSCRNCCSRPVGENKTNHWQWNHGEIYRR